MDNEHQEQPGEERRQDSSIIKLHEEFHQSSTSAEHANARSGSVPVTDTSGFEG